jgi:hypothetical protein
MKKIVQAPIIILIILHSFFAFADKEQSWPKTDFSKSSITLDDITSSGAPKDGRPSIDKPQFIAANKVDNFNPTEPVISITINRDVRAYPLRILMWHGVVNDIVGGTPVAITYDPLCNTSIVYERTVDEKVLQLGTTGQLYNSNMLIYDHDSQSWWQQYTGKAVVGENTGKSLNVVPSRVESLYLFKESYPEARVLIPNDDTAYSYGVNPYKGYDTYFPLMYKGKYTEKLPRMMYLVVVGNEAWPLELLQKKHVIIKDGLTLAWLPNQNSALDSAVIEMGRDIGNIAVKQKTDNGEVDAPYIITFAFAFYAFQPNGMVHTE